MRQLLLVIFAIVVVTAAQAKYLQNPLNTIQIQQQQLEDDLYNAFNSFLESNDPEDAKKNCNSCISILKLTKRFCYFPERIQLAAMSNICKRSKLVDNEVCEGMVREQGPVIRKVLRVRHFYLFICLYA